MTRTTDGLDGEAGDDYVPLSLHARRPAQWPGRAWRIALLAAIVFAHGLAMLWFSELTRPRTESAQDEALVVNFIEDSLPLPPPPVSEPEPDASQYRPAATPRKRPRVRSQVPTQVQSPPPSAAPLELYGADGRLKVPDDLLEQIDRKFGDKRVFSYQIPRMDDARKLMERPPPVIYESTRFAGYWKPDQDILTDLLETMVEKTTGEIRIPVPGTSGTSTMICRVSLMAFGGGCGVLTMGADYVGPLDDPDTLSPEEDRQCRAWWEQIVGANTQDVWRKTRDLYDAECRKPLERAPTG